MADLTQTAANVQLMEDAAVYEQFLAGEAIVQGEPFYKAADNKRYACDATDQTRAQAEGIALTPCAADEYFIGVTSGDIDVGATLTVGTTYVVSKTLDGKISPEADLVTGNYVTHLGVAEAADKLKLAINITGVTKP